jgi:hypothetical protein
MTNASSGLALADYAVVASFFAVMISVGLFFGGKQKNMAQFFGGGKQVPWWLSGISFYMCSFSALAFVMYSALAYKFGWLPITITCIATLAGLFFGSLFLKDDPAHIESLNSFFEKVNTPSPVLEGPPARITFWPLVAGGLAVIGTVLIIAPAATRPFVEIKLSVAGGAGMLAVAGFFFWLSKLSKRGAE